MSKFRYHYSKGHKTAVAAVAIVVILVLAGGFLYWNNSKNVIANSTLNQTQNTTTTCGNNICEAGEAGTCPLCSYGLQACAVFEPCIKGACPQDCQDQLNSQQNTTANTTSNATSNDTANQTQNTTQPPPPAATQGLNAQYFTTTNLAGDVAATKIVPKIDFTWSDSNQPAGGVTWNRFSARFTGNLLMQNEGDYTFIITSDDGSRLYIDGTNVADIWESTGVNSKSTFRKMTAGEHTIKVEYRNIGGGSGKLKLEYWASALNISRQPIPSEFFRP